MKETKTEFKFFSIPEFEEEQDYLRSMQKQGWKLTGITLPGFYHFEACQPEDVVYQLDYHPLYESDRSPYIQIFEDCGWEYLFDFVDYSYFRKPAAQMEGNESIYYDDESRLDMMKRIFKGRVVPLLIIFLVVLLPQSLSALGKLLGHRGGESLDYVVLALTVTFTVFYGWVFVKFAKKYYSYLGRNS